METLPDPLPFAPRHDDVPCGDLRTRALGPAGAAPTCDVAFPPTDAEIA